MSNSLASPWTIDLQASVSMGFPGRILKSGVPSSKGIFPARDWTHVSYVSYIPDRFLALSPEEVPSTSRYQYTFIRKAKFLEIAMTVQC